MSDKGFDFQPPPPRRQPRQFEPPPWEKDQFEQLARERAEQERAEKEAALVAQAEAEQAASEQSVQDEGGGSAERVERAALPGGEDGAVAAESPVGVQEQPVAEPKTVLDERQVELLLLGLREEEPEPLAGMWLVGLVAGAVVVVVGLAISLWGTAALFNSKLGSTGKFGGTVLVVFGVAFVGVGGWLVYGALRQRGVL